MRYMLSIAVIALIMAAGCSSETPPESFLSKNIRVPDTESETFATKQLNLTPKHVFGVFDRNIKEKSWKKVHENAWSLIISGEDPTTKMKNNLEFTFTMAPELEDDVVVSKLIVNGDQYSDMSITEMLVQLDGAMSNQPGGPVLDNQPSAGAE